MTDLIIIGAGPAGLTAAIYAARAGLKVMIFEKETIGGQISSSPLVQNYPGFLSVSGAELSNNLYEQIEKLNVELCLEEVLSIKPGKIKEVVTEYDTYETKAIIIATGAKYRKLNLENEDNLIGKGIHFCTSCDGAFFKDKNVAVVGGGNTAITNAIYMAKIAKKVYLIVRGDKLKCEKSLINDLNNYSNIEVLYKTKVTKIIGNEFLESIIINDKEEIKIDGMFLSIGLDAESTLAKGLLDLNENNYIISPECISSLDGIFIAGDVRDKSLRQLATATSDGAVAATLAINYLK